MARVKPLLVGAQPVSACLQALSARAHPLLMAALALMVRADPLSARLQAVVGHRQAMFPCLHPLLVALHTITIVLDRMYGHRHDVKSYQYRVQARQQALLIVFYRM